VMDAATDGLDGLDGFRIGFFGDMRRERAGALDHRFHESCHNRGIPLEFPDSI
jgi:hypothetical protein